MLPTILRAGEIGLLALVAYNAITALPGWPTPQRAPRSSRRQRFRVVVAAHDEAAVIGTLLDDLARLDYDAALLTVWVLADRCTDDTATIARSRGARVSERQTGPSGKGAVLREHLETHPLDEDEALVVIDADNRIPTDLLARFADELAAGGHALQAYLDVANPGASPLTTASALSYWAGNRMVQLARTRLGWPADLGGTGMCLTREALERAGGFGDSLTEDADLGARLARAGIPVRWIHDVRIGDEKPTTVGVVIRQRARWTAGRRGVARRHALPLLGAALRRSDGGLADLALRLVQPGRSFVALLSGILAVLAATVASDVLLPPGLWAAAASTQFLMPLAFLAREGVAPRYLAAYPLLLLLAALWIPVRIASRLTRGWYHTPHQGG
ncbi:MAG: glycosyltransferase family 2 protein [Acidimicrobiia bacterium]